MPKQNEWEFSTSQNRRYRVTETTDPDTGNSAGTIKPITQEARDAQSIGNASLGGDPPSICWLVELVGTLVVAIVFVGGILHPRTGYWPVAFILTIIALVALMMVVALGRS